MKPIILIIFLLFSTNQIHAQDTYSIVAVDTITGEVGSAGASCIDLTGFGLTADFLGDLIPGKAAINTQSYYLSQNQANARRRALMGEDAKQIINWLENNDYDFNPGIRQYGIVTFHNKQPVAAGFTGIDCLDWKGHHSGADYNIQGNILKGPEIIDSMQARYLRTQGNLVDKLMSAMQGAKVIGADSRCEIEGTSALFAFLKVSKKDDKDKMPSIRFGVILRSNSKMEPIDSLQKLVDIWKQTTATENFHPAPSIICFPNPFDDVLSISNFKNDIQSVSIHDMLGQLMYVENFNEHNAVISVPTESIHHGCYLLKIQYPGGNMSKLICKK